MQLDIHTIRENLLKKEIEESISTSNPLKTAIFGKKLLAVRYYIENGYDIHFDREFPLKFFACKGDLETVKLLLDKGANIKEDNFLLVRAIEKKKNKVVKFLLEQGCIVGSLDLSAAIKQNDIEMIELLLKHTTEKIKIYDMKSAIYSKNIKIIKLFLQYGADFTQTEVITCIVENLNCLLNEDYEDYEYNFVKQNINILSEIFEVIIQHCKLKNKNLIINDTIKIKKNVKKLLISKGAVIPENIKETQNCILM